MNMSFRCFSIGPRSRRPHHHCGYFRGCFLPTFLLPAPDRYFCTMINTKLAIVRSTINLRGHRFPAGTVVRVWETSSVTSIQPAVLPSPLHEAMWYMFPEIHLKDLRKLEDHECQLVDYGIY